MAAEKYPSTPGPCLFYDYIVTMNHVQHTVVRVPDS